MYNELYVECLESKRKEMRVTGNGGSRGALENSSQGTTCISYIEK